MKELKAVEILSRIRKTPQDLFRYSDRDFDEALAELQALESYIEEQIVECQKVIDTKKADMFTYYEADGLRQAYTDILQKIKGEKC